MRPLRLVLDGFCAYREPTDIDFTGVDFFALVGPTGSGKSTIIDGICFALYGTVPRWNNKSAVAEALAPSVNKALVALVFEAHGGRYVAVRDVRRTKAGVGVKEQRLEQIPIDVDPATGLAELLERRVRTLASGREVTQAVERLLGLNYEHFTRSVMLPQGRFAEFLQAKPSERNDTLVELLAYGVYEQVGKRARERRKRADTELALQIQARARVGATPEFELAAAQRVAALEALESDVAGGIADLRRLVAERDEAVAAARAARADVAQLHVVVPASTQGFAAEIATAAARVAAATADVATAEDDIATAKLERKVLGDAAQLHRWADAYRRGAVAAAAVTTAQDALTPTESAQRAAVETATEARELADRAAAAWHAAERANQAAALATTLAAGGECPVCRQLVTTVPEHAHADDLVAAQAKAEKARATADRADKSARSAINAADKARADLEAKQRQVDAVRAETAGAPSEAEVAETLAAIADAVAAVDAGEERLRAARAALRGAADAREKLSTAETSARSELTRTRDALVRFGAPDLDATDLARAWQQLADWADAERERRITLTADLDRTAESATAAATERSGSIVTTLAAAGIAIADPATAEVALARELTNARRDLENVRGELASVRRLDATIARLTEQRDVAKLLGDQLDARNFETWLCAEALDSLIVEASATLLTLSGGQYELDRNDRNELIVTDHNDVGTSRPVHTLSGGETFQASLALALALSRQVVSLSANMRDLNSMFLDEGFGTLDEQTLDVVAETLEQLAAESDRMIGVVTHVSALAERVPVQFAVTREGTTARVAKVRT